MTRTLSPEHQNCGTCRFAGWTGTEFYKCRRHAPIARDEQNHRGGITESHWPMVESHQWCGDYEPLPAPPEVKQGSAA